jgi:molecular chaperone GrpE
MNRRPPFPGDPDDLDSFPVQDGWDSLIREDAPAVDGFFAGKAPETPAPEDLSPETPAPEDPVPGILDAETLAALCAERVCPGCPEKREADEVRLRALAELDNARKRLAREREEQARFASEAVLTAVIPSLDNLNLALQHAAPAEARTDFVTGVRMTRDLLLDALKQHGLQSVGEVGEVFDPARHEAVGVAASDEVPDGCVCSLLTAGYTLHGRLLRPAKVLVCKKS